MGAKLKIEGIDCVKVNLVNEDLLKVAKRETLELKATNSKLTQELKTLKNMLATQHMEMKGLRVQVKIPYCFHCLVRNSNCFQFI